MGKIMSLSEWMGSDDFKELVEESHLKNRIRSSGKTQSQIEILEEQLAFGESQGISFGKSFSKLVNSMNNLGFSQVNVEKANGGTYKIEFRQIGEKDNEVSLLINPTDENGITSSGSTPSLNSFIKIRGNENRENKIREGGKGRSGLVSSLAFSLEKAAEDIEARRSSLERIDVRNKGELSRELQSILGRGVSDVTSRNPSLSSKNQREDFENAFDITGIKNMATSLVKNMGMQVVTLSYYEDIYRRYRTELNRIGFKNLESFMKEMGDIELGIMRSSSNIKEFEKGFKEKNFKLYSLLWEKEIKNDIEETFGIGIGRTPRREGVSGVIPFGKDFEPFSALSPRSRRTPSQNARGFSKPYKGGEKGTKGFAPDITYTEGQFTKEQLEKGLNKKNLYLTGEISDKALHEGWKRFVQEEYLKDTYDKNGKKIGNDSKIPFSKKMEMLFNDELYRMGGKEGRDLIKVPDTFRGMILQGLKGVESEGSVIARQIRPDFSISENYTKVLNTERVDKELEDLLAHAAVPAPVKELTSEKIISSLLKPFKGTSHERDVFLEKKQEEAWLKKYKGLTKTRENREEARRKDQEEAIIEERRKNIRGLNRKELLEKYRGLKTPQERIDFLKKEMGVSEEKIKEAMLRSADLSSTLGTSVQGYDYDEINGNYVTQLKRKVDSASFTARGGNGVDNRTVETIIPDLVLGYAFEIEGYDKKDIWIDEKDHSKGLKMTQGRERRDFSSKKAQSDFVGLYNFFVSGIMDKSLAAGKTEEDALKDVINIFDEFEFKGRHPFKGILSIGENGNLKVDNEKFEKSLKVKGATKGKNGNPDQESWEGALDVLQGIITLGYRNGMVHAKPIGPIGYRNGKARAKPSSKLPKGVKKISLKGRGEKQLFEGSKEDKDVFKLQDWVAPIPTLEQINVASIEHYEGIEEENKNRPTIKIKRQELRSLRNSAGHMRVLGYEKDAEKIDEMADSLKLELNKQEELYAPYKRNAEFLAGKFGDNFSSDVATKRKEFVDKYGGVILDSTKGDLAGVVTELNFDENGAILGGEKTSLQKRIEEKQEARYKELIKESKKNIIKENSSLEGEKLEEAARKDLEERMGIFSSHDIQVSISSGMDRYIANGNQVGGLVTLGLGKTRFGKNSRGEDVNYPDEIAQKDMKIVGTIIKLQNKTITPEKAGKIIAETTSEILTSIEKGSIFEDTHEIRGANGGYLLIHGLNREVAKDLLGEDSSGKRLIMNVDDYAENLSSALENASREGGKKEDVESLLKFAQAYKKILGKDWVSDLDLNSEKIKESGSEENKKFLKSFRGGKRKKTKAFADALNIKNNAKNKGKGVADANFVLSRAPWVKGRDDALTGVTISTADASVVSRGNLLADAGLVKAFNADFDGDRIAIYKAIEMGDWEKAHELIGVYEDHLTQAEEVSKEKLREKGTGKGGKKSDLKSLGSEKEQRDKDSSIQSGKKLAGIYGDLVDAVKIETDDLGLGYGKTSAKGSSDYKAIVGEIFTQTHAQLYQNGINIKNSKGEKDKVSAVEKMELLRKLSLNGNTWDDYDNLLNFLKKEEDLGVFNAENFFDNKKGLGPGFDTIGLEEVKKGEEGEVKKNLTAIFDSAIGKTKGKRKKELERRKEEFLKNFNEAEKAHKNSDETTRQSAAQAAFSNFFTPETIAELITNKEIGFNGLVAKRNEDEENKTGESISAGTIIHDRYKILSRTGGGSSPVSPFSYDNRYGFSGKQVDPETEKFLINNGFAEKGKNKGEEDLLFPTERWYGKNAEDRMRDDLGKSVTAMESRKDGETTNSKGFVSSVTTSLNRMFPYNKGVGIDFEDFRKHNLIEDLKNIGSEGQGLRDFREIFAGVPSQERALLFSQMKGILVGDLVHLYAQGGEKVLESRSKNTKDYQKAHAEAEKEVKKNRWEELSKRYKEEKVQKTDDEISREVEEDWAGRTQDEKEEAIIDAMIDKEARNNPDYKKNMEMFGNLLMVENGITNYGNWNDETLGPEGKKILRGDILKAQLSDVEKKGRAQSRSFLNQIGHGKDNKNKILATEVDLFSPKGGKTKTGIADIVYSKRDEENDRQQIIIGDYKNYKRGDLTPNSVLQVLEYMDMLKDFQKDVNEQTKGAKNAMSFNEYLSLGTEGRDPTYSRALRSRIDYIDHALGLKQDEWKKQGKSEKQIEELSNEYKERQKEELGRIYEELKANPDAEIQGRISIASANGVVSLYKLTDNGKTKDILEKLRKRESDESNGVNFTDEETKAFQTEVLQSAELVSSEIYDLQKYANFVNKVLPKDGPIHDYVEAKKNLLRKKSDLSGIRRRIETEENLPERDEAKIDDLKKKEKELEEEINGKTVGGVKETGYEDSVKNLENLARQNFGDSAEGTASWGDIQAYLSVLQTGSEEENKLSDFSHRRSEFSFLNKLKKQYEKKAGEIKGILDFDDAHHSLSEEEREDLNEQLKQLDDVFLQKINDRIKSLVDSIKKTFEEIDGKEGLSEEQRQKFKEKEDEFDKEKERGEKSGESAREKSRVRGLIKERKRKAAEEDEVFGIYKARNNYLLKEKELEMRINNENDPTAKSYLVEQQKYLAERRSIAQQEVDALESEATDDPHRKINKEQENKANLDYQIKLQDFYLRNGISAPGTSGKKGGRGFLTTALGNSSQMMVSRLLNGTLFYQVFAKIRQGLSLFTNEAKVLDKVLTNLRIVTNDSASSTRSLISTYASLGHQLGATTSEVSSSALEWLRQGYKASEAMDLVTSSLYLSKLGMIDTATATKDLTSSLKGFKLGASQSMDVVDKLTAIDLKAATSAGDIAEGLAKFANLGSLSGVNIDEAAAYVATISDVTQMSGESAGQALKTIISRFGNVKASAYNKINFDSDTEDTGSLNDVEKVLKKLDINVRDSKLEFRDFDDVLSDIASKWGSLDTVSQKAVANAFAGVRQQEAFVTLLQNWDKYEELLETSQNSRGTAKKKYESYKESYEATKNSVTASFEKFVNSSEFSEILKALLKIGDFLAKLLPYIVKFGPGLLQMVATAYIATGNNPVQKGLDFLTKKGVSLGGDVPTFFSRMKEAPHVFLKRKPGEKAPVSTPVAAPAPVTAERVTTSVVTAADGTTKTTVTRTTTTTTTTAPAGAATAPAGQTPAEQSAAPAETVAPAGAATPPAEQPAVVQPVAAPAGQTPVGTATAPASAVAAQANMVRGNRAAISYGVTQLSSGLMSYTTSGLSHKTASGETVDSSEEAHKKARAASTAISMAVPFIGSTIGTFVGEAIAKSTDKIRDSINELTNKAQENLSTLQSMSVNIGNLSSLADTSGVENQAEKEKIKSSILTEIYGSDKKNLRKEINSFLKEVSGDNKATIRSVLDTYVNSSTEDSVEAAKQLEIAQLKATNAETENARAKEIYDYQKSVKEAKLDYNATKKGYTDKGISNEAETGAVLGGAVVGGATGAAVGGLAAAAAAAGATGVGIPAAVILGIAAAVLAGVSAANALESEAQQEEVSKKEWESLDLNGKISAVEEEQESLRDEIDKASESNDEANDETIADLENQLAASEDLLDTLNDVKEYTAQIAEENNKNSMKVALEEAQAEVGGQKKYLTNMTTDELMTLELSDIYGAIAENLTGNETLEGMSVYENGKNSLEEGETSDFSQQYIDYVKTVMTSNDELSARLQGKTYSLSEAFANLDENKQFDKEIFQSFANAIGVSLKDLLSNKSVYEGKFGNLKLSDMLSTDDLSKKMTGYNSLLEEITDSTKSASEWMNTIVSQYPELVAYMSDTPELMKHIMETLAEANDYSLQTSWENYAKSQTAFSTKFLPEIVEKLIGNEESGYNNDNKADAEDLLKSKGSTYEDLIKYAESLDLSDASSESDQKKNQAIYDAIMKSDFGISLTSDVYKEALENYIDYEANQEQKVVDNLNAQKEAMQNINSQREYELKLMKAKLSLQDALDDKTRVYRAGVGWVYEADQSKIKEAQDNLDDVKNEKKISSLTAQIALHQQNVDSWKGIWNTLTEENQKKEAEAFENSAFMDLNKGADINQGFSSVVDAVDGLQVSFNILTNQNAKKFLEEKEAAITNLNYLYGVLTDKGRDWENNPSGWNNALDEYQTAYNDAWTKEYINEDSYNGWKGDKRAFGSAESKKLAKDTSAKKDVKSEFYLGGETVSGITPALQLELSNFIAKIRREEGASLFKSDSMVLSDWLKTPGNSLSDEGLSEDIVRFSSNFQNDVSGDFLYKFNNSDESINSIKKYATVFSSDLMDEEGDDGKKLLKGIKKGDGFYYYWDDGGKKTVRKSIPPEKIDSLSALAQNNLFSGGGSFIVSSNGVHALVKDGLVYKVDTEFSDADTGSKVWGSLVADAGSENASGTLDLQGNGESLINELGTEAIVTPEGTLTSLPSHTGIVPADITKNLWSLGEVAPSILRAISNGPVLGTAFSSLSSLATDESFNIDKLTMNVSADNTFDADAFVESIKQRVALTRNNRK